VAVLYPSLSPTVSTSASKDTICQGGNTTLSAFGATNYNWYHLQGGVLTPISNTYSVNVTPPSIGTNTYVATGYAPCASSVADTEIITVYVTPITNLIVTPLLDATKCLNTSLVFEADVNSTIPSNQGTPYSYAWTTLPGNIPAPGSNTDSSYIATANITTTLVVTVSGECAYSTSDTVVVKNFVDDLAISIIDSSSTCAKTKFTLNTITIGGRPVYNYSWYMIPNTDAISSSSNLAYTSPESEGTYTIAVTVNDSCGYSKTDYEVIVVLPPCNVFIPNIITPNGDGANEFFKIKNIEHHPNTTVTIFDRWGIKVYENPNYNNEWKAEGVSDGTFFYIINVPEDKTYNGFITVFRDK
jgi:gliding motility-associated-like protein